MSIIKIRRKSKAKNFDSYELRQYISAFCVAADNWPHSTCPNAHRHIQANIHLDPHIHACMYVERAAGSDSSGVFNV